MSVALAIARAGTGAARPGPGALATARRHESGWWRGLGVLIAVYFFIVAINMIGDGLKTIATVPTSSAWLQAMYGYARHPVAGLCFGILLTSVVQSSSFTTSFAVTLVASGQVPLELAIPVIMGANVGTSVTNILVSLAHLRRRVEFRRSLAGAIVHDLFNVLSVLVLMPLEWAFGILTVPARTFAGWLGGTAFSAAHPNRFAFVKAAVRPMSRAVKWVLMDLFGLPAEWAGAIQAVLAVVLLFAALVFMVKMLRGLMTDRLSTVFSRTLFRNPATSFLVGIVVTATVQSSSVTTSLVVPLVGAGILKIRQIYPYTLGANIGTTVTAILAGLAAAALASGASPEAQTLAASALAVAFAHLLFNIYGTCIFWPLQWVPISLAKGYAKLASNRRVLAAVYIFVIFFVVPIALIVLVNRL